MRLFRIEARRSVARWMALLCVAVAALDLWNDLAAIHVLLWADSSTVVRGYAAFVAGPLIAGAAAWMAGRERRRGVEELLASTPFAEAPRHMITWAGTLFWGIVSAFLVGAAVFAITAWGATWGRPVLWPGVVGLLALTTYSAGAYVLGVFLPSRFTPPLVAIALFMGQDVGIEAIMTRLDESDAPGWLVALSPVVPLHNTAWYGVQPDIGLAQSLFLLGVTGLLLATLGLREPRYGTNKSVATMVLVPAGLVLAGMLLLANDPDVNWTGTNWAPDWPVIPHEPVCAGEAVPVCLHPAFRPVLADLVSAVERMAAPLAGIPGVPSRVEQAPSVDEDAHEVAVADGVIALTLSAESSSAAAAHLVARALVSDGESATPTQAALEAWLLRRAGLEPQCDLVEPSAPKRFAFTPGECAAAGRFAALDRGEQRRWLEAHYTALREGHLSLEALP